MVFDKYLKKCNSFKSLKELEYLCYNTADSHTSFVFWTRDLVVLVEYDSITKSFLL